MPNFIVKGTITAMTEKKGGRYKRNTLRAFSDPFFINVTGEVVEAESEEEAIDIVRKKELDGAIDFSETSYFLRRNIGYRYAMVGCPPDTRLIAKEVQEDSLMRLRGERELWPI